ncbi:MAG: acyl-CoA reductase [Clostridiales bacterium]|nr:acyl-CoA reductase [Clostridiales bacterium]
MILYNGQIYGTEMQQELLERLPEDLNGFLKTDTKLNIEDVITACDTLAKRVKDGEFDDTVKPFLETFGVSKKQFDDLLYMFSRDGLQKKIDIELPDREETISGFRRKRYPLGILLHIAAGNLDVLPAYSVTEGLLAGNINILKLPMGDSGLSVKLLSEMISISPSLAPFIYVFDVPSTETESIKKLADISDGIAVWGGDAAISAARHFANVNTKIIAWGHKLSFAYCEPDCTDEDLRELARSICITNQTLCSSCQGIFLDTDSDEEADSFGERFFTIFTEVNASSKPADYGMRAKNAINIYNEKLEQHETKSRIFSKDGISVIVKRDSGLELSYMYRSVWIKKLPMDKIHLLHKNKGHLQTASVLTSNIEKRKQISDILANAGVVRITSSGNMSRTVPGEAHDGTYALREYSRIVETEFY